MTLEFIKPFTQWRHLSSAFVSLCLSATLLFMSPHAQGEDRVAMARARSEAQVRARFAHAGVAYPAEELFFRAFKREAALELWARGAGAQKEFRLIHTYAWTVNSGQPGPKRREGDRQIPEGFYQIDGFNPKSRFHLSLPVNYPNASDRVRSDAAKPGFDIYIHGNEKSVGCLALGDAAIEEVYLMALDARNRETIAAHIFPARMQGTEWKQLREAHPAHATFWAELQPGFDAFERTKRVPRVTIEEDGRYVVQP